MKDIVLVSMPWAPCTEPTLGLAILKSCLSQKGFNAKVFHAAPKLLKWITIETYEFLADCWGIDEFLFTAALDPLCDEKQLSGLIERSSHYAEGQRFRKAKTTEDYCKLFLKVRHEIIPLFLEECAEEILAYSPKLIGFTCMFDQTISSIVLSKILKERLEDCKIILGGYALEGCAGSTVSASFPWIDSIVQGDGEETICSLATKIISNASADIKIPKIIKSAKIDLNESPNPDYTDWFEDMKKLKQKDKIKINPKVLPVESSRGCWWGQHMHCIFCGIDDETLKYRFKKPEKTLEMLRSMRDKYGDVAFRFSDYIMPKAYYDTLMVSLANEEPKFRLQSEIKANHTKQRIKAFADAGFFEMQPGIESFSTNVLKSMDKGVRAIDNVKLLKYGYLYGIIIDYNFLYGLPDDKLEDYQKMAELIPRIYHLTPPISRNETVVTKFAPLQINPERFGIKTKAIHHRCYDILFSQSYMETCGLNLDDYAYYYERNFDYNENLEILYSQLTLQIEHWKTIHKNNFVELSYMIHDSNYHFVDTRYNSIEEYFISENEAKVYAICDEAPVKIDKIAELILQKFEEIITLEEVENSIEILRNYRLIWEDSGFIFGVAIPKEVSDLYKENEWTKSWMSLYV